MIVAVDGVLLVTIIVPVRPGTCAFSDVAAIPIAVSKVFFMQNSFKATSAEGRRARRRGEDLSLLFLLNKKRKNSAPSATPRLRA
jgi:hypothetical protein